MNATKRIALVLPRALRALVLTSALCGAYTLCAASRCQTVTYDENDEISPAAAKTVISNACSAVVAVNLAEARAEILIDVAQIATGVLKDANDLLTSHSDYVLLDLVAVGIEDALAPESAVASDGRIDIVQVAVDRSSQANTLVTLTWQYTTGSFSAPQIMAAASITNGTVFAAVPQTEPEQISWGTNSAYRATATLDNAIYGAKAFFKIEATPDAPIDDGQVFDIYSDGTDFTLDLIPSKRYRLRIVSGRITTVQLME